MVERNHVEQTRWAMPTGIYSSAAWLQVLIVVGSMGLTNSGWAVAENAEATDPPDQEDSIKTSADYLTPVHSSTHSPVPQASLTLPLPSVARPEILLQCPSSSVSVTSSPPAAQPMFSPVPPPPQAAITITIPASATAPTMAESLLQPAAMPIANGSATQAPDSGPEVSLESGSGEAAEATPSSPVVPAAIAADESVPEGYNSVFIDPTGYDLGATQAPAATTGDSPEVVFAERTTGCQITVAAGQTSADAACAPAASASARADQGEIRVGPLTVGPRGVSLGSTTIVSREALNERLRPLNVLRRGNEAYVFPLSVPASISSLFGWRMHPIQQSWRFHSGTDLAAPIGTPVLATRAGQVSVADVMGGYGLTVILRHDDGSLESRYAHLSQLTVQAGDWVEQGEVIGLVGSTGTSTGPHLHFELRQLTAEGWVAVDPIDVLQDGVANLLEIIDNPLLALGRSGATTPGAEDGLPADYPFRPAQPNAS